MREGVEVLITTRSPVAAGRTAATKIWCPSISIVYDDGGYGFVPLFIKCGPRMDLTIPFSNIAGILECSEKEAAHYSMAPTEQEAVGVPNHPNPPPPPPKRD